MGPRQILKPDRTPIQQCMVVDPADYNNFNMSRAMLGIVLDVHLADDSSSNRIAAQFSDERGFMHVASVLIIDDGGPSNLIPPDVVVTPDSRTGVDDYSENLPKGSTCLITGDELNDGLNNINPHSLDGDMCVVMFMGGRLDSGFIVRWWPHTANTFDPATSGEGNKDISGEGTSLDQSGRSFTRINGVEYVVTREGNVYLSTSLSGTKIIPGKPSSIGRFARTRIANGGNIRVNVKPTALMEIDFNFQEDGVGSGNLSDPSLPQTNPSGTEPYSLLHSGEFALDGTYIRLAEKKVSVEVPEEISLKSGDRVFIEAESENNILSKGTTTIDSEGVLNLDTRDALFAVAEGPLVLEGQTVSVGAVTLDEDTPAGLITVQQDGTVLLGPEGAVVGGVELFKQFLIIDSESIDRIRLLPFNQGKVEIAVLQATAAIDAAGAAPTPAQTGTALAAIGVALDEINTLLQALGSAEFTKAN